MIECSGEQVLSSFSLFSLSLLFARCSFSVRGRSSMHYQWTAYEYRLRRIKKEIESFYDSVHVRTIVHLLSSCYSPISRRKDLPVARAWISSRHLSQGSRTRGELFLSSLFVKMRSRLQSSAQQVNVVFVLDCEQIGTQEEKEGEREEVEEIRSSRLYVCVRLRLFVDRSLVFVVFRCIALVTFQAVRW